MIKHPYYPIIYVRGYAGSQGEVENTVATPYVGFNLGSVKYRQAYRKELIEPWIFESPLIRLMKDHDYVDAYSNGELMPDKPVKAKSVWIFRYYDIVSEDIGEGERKEIEFHAKRLREFILHVRDCVLAKEGGPKSKFRVYLVAHSMGGLICRCYLQNSSIPDLDGKKPGENADKGVDKLFTYATPHGGIEFRKGLGWVEGLRDFLDANNAGNFGEKRMKEFLDLGGSDLQSLEDRFPVDRVFSLVGTDSRDYGAAAGLSRRSVGPVSDGLVQISNAYVRDAPRAFVHRSHSGHYGIVNSEEGYQNLQRFLFGQVQAKFLMDNVKVKLPESLKGKKNVTAVYYIEIVVSIRRIPVEIHRRTIDSDSAIFRDRKTITSRPTHLYTVYLDRKYAKGKSLGFQVRVRVLPVYHVNRKFWPDNHFEGGAIYDDAYTFIITPKKKGPSKVTCLCASDNTNKPVELGFSEDGEEKNARISFKGNDISGDFVIHVLPWNDWA